jgi:hypothetical protein
MPHESETLLLRLIGGDHAAADEVLALAGSSGSPTLLVAASLVTAEQSEAAALIARAATRAATTRDRQLVAIAGAHLKDDSDLSDALVRDHLSEHPDSILAAWIASQRGARPSRQVHRRPAAESEDPREEDRHVRDTFEAS